MSFYYKVKPKDLIGQIKNFPIEIVQAMVDRQVEQGNAADVSVFQNNNMASTRFKGFDWYSAKEGADFWIRIIRNNTFDIFFEKYPKVEDLVGRYIKALTDHPEGGDIKKDEFGLITSILLYADFPSQRDYSFSMEVLYGTHGNTRKYELMPIGFDPSNLGTSSLEHKEQTIENSQQNDTDKTINIIEVSATSPTISTGERPTGNKICGLTSPTTISFGPLSYSEITG